MRLDKLLAQGAGLSRSDAKKAVREGRVRVDGQPESDAGRKIGESRKVSLDGQAVGRPDGLHLMMNKPAGVLTAARDARARTVMDLLPEGARRAGCMPAGRLDKDTEGLLLLTTDGEMAHRLLSPKRGIAKEYRARVTGTLGKCDVAAFMGGVRLKDFTAKPAALTILESGGQTSLARVVLHEGKNRQVRRMFSALGHEVTALERLRFGPLTLDAGLPKGGWRELTAEELAALREAVSLG